MKSEYAGEIANTASLRINIRIQHKPRTLFAGLKIKEEIQETYLQRLSSIRRNITLILHYSDGIPFHWSTRGYRCFYCRKPMRDCTVLKEHTRKHKVDLESFIPQRIITKDIPVKLDVANLSCKVCPEDMDSLNDLVTHIEEVHGENYDHNAGVCVFPFLLNKDVMNCVICEGRYDNFFCLVTHMYKDHVTHTFVCQMCGLSFINKIRLKRHISSSHIGHKCSVCKKMFDAFHKMEKHKERIHGMVKSNECGLCSENFGNKYQLKVHMGKVHNVEKYRIKCEHCPKVTTTKGAMLLHVQSMHSEMRYSCEYCEYNTGIKWMIKLHKRKHFGDKDYACSICERKFGRSSNLRAHMKTHTGNVGRVCRSCKKGFTDLESLNSHEMEAHYFKEYE